MHVANILIVSDKSLFAFWNPCRLCELHVDWLPLVVFVSLEYYTNLRRILLAFLNCFN